METREQKMARLAELRDGLLCVEGTSTEVYSRIVGYYRSVRNWNAGKREEFGKRVEFSFPSAAGSGPKPRTGIVSYLVFTRAACPNCPAVRDYLAGSDLPGVVVDVDTADGLDLARQYEVLSTPTAILLDAAGDEVTRARDRAVLTELLEPASIPVPVTA
jgi:ribonucleoside-triphosphate reductase